MTNPRFWEFSAKDLLQVVIYGGMLLIFLVKSDNRINSLEEFQRGQAVVNTKILEYMQNSDGYHSAVHGTQFLGGKPANPSFDLTRMRHALSRVGSSTAYAATDERS